LTPEIGAATPSAAQALIVALPERVRELAARLGQASANASRPPSSDPRQAPPRPKAPLSGRQRGGRKALDRTLMPGI
jgi:transposase